MQTTNPPVSFWFSVGLSTSDTQTNPIRRRTLKRKISKADLRCILSTTVRDSEQVTQTPAGRRFSSVEVGDIACVIAVGFRRTLPLCREIKRLREYERGDGPKLGLVCVKKVASFNKRFVLDPRGHSRNHRSPKNKISAGLEFWFTEACHGVGNFLE